MYRDNNFHSRREVLIVSSPSRNFHRCTGCFEANINIACRNTQNAARKLSLAFKDYT